MTAAVGDLPVLTLQDPFDVKVAVVYDCRPPLLPVLLPLSTLGPMTGLHARGTSVSGPPCVEGHSIIDMDTDVITIHELVAAPLNGSGTDLENELPTPANTPVSCEVRPVITDDPTVRPEQEDNLDLELAKVLLDVSVMPMMISSINDPMVSPAMSPTEYAAPAIPTESADERVPGVVFPPAPVTTCSLIREYSPISMVSSGGVDTRPTSPLLSPIRPLTDELDPPPRRRVTMDQYLQTPPGELSDSPVEQRDS